MRCIIALVNMSIIFARLGFGVDPAEASSLQLTPYHLPGIPCYLTVATYTLPPATYPLPFITYYLFGGGDPLFILTYR